MQFTFLPLFLALASAQGYNRLSACRPLANGLISDCGSSTDTFQIKDVILTPPIPVAGKPIDVHLIGNLKEDITLGSKPSIGVSVDGFPIGTFDLDICQLVKDRKFQNKCPVKAKHFDVYHTLKIPAYAPRGTYRINASGFNQNKVRIFNITIRHTSKGL